MPSAPPLSIPTDAPYVAWAGMKERLAPTVEALDAVLASLPEGAVRRWEGRLVTWACQQAPEHMLPLVARLLQWGISPQLPLHTQGGTRTYSLLSFAVERCPALVGPLLTAGADPDGPDNPLGVALIASDGERVRLLLEAGANPNGRKGDLMHTAAEHSTLPVFQMLLSAGGDPNANPSPLLQAAGSHQPKKVALLLKAGAQPIAPWQLPHTIATAPQTAMEVCLNGLGLRWRQRDLQRARNTLVCLHAAGIEVRPEASLDGLADAVAMSKEAIAPLIPVIPQAAWAPPGVQKALAKESNLKGAVQAYWAQQHLKTTLEPESAPAPRQRPRM